MAQKKVSKGLALAWLLLFIVTGFLVFNPVVFGVDLYPLTIVLLGVLVLVYEGRIRPALVGE